MTSSPAPQPLKRHIFENSNSISSHKSWLAGILTQVASQAAWKSSIGYCVYCNSAIMFHTEHIQNACVYYFWPAQPDGGGSSIWVRLGHHRTHLTLGAARSVLDSEHRLMGYNVLENGNGSLTPYNVMEMLVSCNCAIVCIIMVAILFNNAVLIILILCWVVHLILLRCTQLCIYSELTIPAQFNCAW